MDLLRCRVHEVVCFIRWIFRFSKSSRHRSRIVNLFGEGANKADFLNGAESSDVVLVKKYRAIMMVVPPPLAGMRAIEFRVLIPFSMVEWS